jgi:hypothetical protein
MLGLVHSALAESDDAPSPTKSPNRYRWQSQPKRAAQRRRGKSNLYTLRGFGRQREPILMRQWLVESFGLGWQDAKQEMLRTKHTWSRTLGSRERPGHKKRMRVRWGTAQEASVLQRAKNSGAHVCSLALPRIKYAGDSIQPTGFHETSPLKRRRRPDG